MNVLGDPSQGRGHSLSDWLELHELDPATCRNILSAVPQISGGAPSVRKPSPAYRAPDRELAWDRTVVALRDFLPEQHAIIEETFEKCIKVDAPPGKNPRQAFTLDNGLAAYPTIVYSYLREPSDPLIMAHEFGHALQIRASRGQFVSPIMREVCAFISEMALLAHILRIEPEQHTHVFREWVFNNHQYFGPQKDRLLSILSRSETRYRYAWNYPIARSLANRIAGQCSRDRIWSIFKGEVTVRAALHELASRPGGSTMTDRMGTYRSAP